MTFDLLFDYFNLLTDTPNSIPKLRELNLQLAVQGKLVLLCRFLFHHSKNKSTSSPKSINL